MSPAFFSRGGARLVLATAAMLVCTVLGASCVKVLKLDDYAAALADLCAQLGQCYGADFYADCVERTEARLDGASPEERAAFLEAYGESACLDNCINARACLDEAPICGGVADGCGMLEQCCGFTKGETQCKAGSCCRPLGSLCNEGSECCLGKDGSELRCTAPEGGGPPRCGGVVCALEGEECGGGAGQCCGEGLRCDPFEHFCHLCNPLMAECDDPSDCCSNYCGFEFGTSGTCQPSPCLANLEGCTDDKDCCGGYCVDVFGQRMCSDCPGGAPDGAPCGVAATEDGPADPVFCCHGCDPMTGVCGGGACLAPGERCDDPNGLQCCQGYACAQMSSDGLTCCGLDGVGGCMKPDDCCSGDCVMGVCFSPTDCTFEPGQPCMTDEQCPCSFYCQPDHGCCSVVASCQEPCFEGPPLRPDWCFMQGDPNFDCVTAVCADPAFSYCCCDAWDGGCVAAVEDHCSFSCSMTQ